MSTIVSLGVSIYYVFIIKLTRKRTGLSYKISLVFAPGTPEKNTRKMSCKTFVFTTILPYSRNCSLLMSGKQHNFL